jgi:hypothetical protein
VDLHRAKPDDRHAIEFQDERDRSVDASGNLGKVIEHLIRTVEAQRNSRVGRIDLMLRMTWPETKWWSLEEVRLFIVPMADDDVLPVGWDEPVEQCP